MRKCMFSFCVFVSDSERVCGREKSYVCLCECVSVCVCVWRCVLGGRGGLCACVLFVCPALEVTCLFVFLCAFIIYPCLCFFRCVCVCVCMCVCVCVSVCLCVCVSNHELSSFLPLCVHP